MRRPIAGRSPYIAPLADPLDLLQELAVLRRKEHATWPSSLKIVNLPVGLLIKIDALLAHHERTVLRVVK